MATSPVIHPRSNESSSPLRNGLYTTGRIRPNKEDWQRWKPMIMQRYKTITARVLVGEMNAEDFQVTEKMLRDRLRQWECNNKNVRKANGNNHQSKALQGLGNGNNPSAQENQHYPCHRDLASLIRSARASLFNPLQTPKESRLLRQTLKGVQDWQFHVIDSGQDWNAILSDAYQFYDQLIRMKHAVRLLRYSHLPITHSFRELREAGTELGHNFGTACTPLAIFIAFGALLCFKQNSSSHEADVATSAFFLSKATEALHPSDPALQLMRQMLLGEHTPEALAMIHEVGCVFLTSAYGMSQVLKFRAEFLKATKTLGLIATFRPYLETLTDALDGKDGVDDALLLDLAVLRYHDKRFDECAKLARRCLNVLQTQGRETSWMAHHAWNYIASTHGARSDSLNEEDALQNALTIAELMERDVAFKSGRMNLNVLETIWRLHRCYKRQDKQDKCEVLSLRYPHVFAED